LEFPSSARQRSLMPMMPKEVRSSPLFTNPCRNPHRVGHLKGYLLRIRFQAYPYLLAERILDGIASGFLRDSVHRGFDFLDGENRGSELEYV